MRKMNKAKLEKIKLIKRQEPDKKHKRIGFLLKIGTYLVKMLGLVC